MVDQLGFFWSQILCPRNLFAYGFPQREGDWNKKLDKEHFKRLYHIWYHTDPFRFLEN